MLPENIQPDEVDEILDKDKEKGALAREIVPWGKGTCSACGHLEFGLLPSHMVL